jgi:DNA-binding beta-propeller fold protein YncE
MRTLAGVCTQSGSSPDSNSTTKINSTTALLNNPFGVAYDDVAQRVFIADAGNNRIRYVGLWGERGLFINRWAGTGVAGFSGDGGLASEARLRNPQTMAFSPTFDKMYIGDTTNLRIRVTTQSP